MANYIRSISIILLSVVFAVGYLADLGVVMVFLFMIAAPLLLVLGCVAIYSIVRSFHSLFTKEREPLCVRIANWTMLASLLVCISYTVGMTLYVHYRYHIVAVYQDPGGVSGGFYYKLFAKDGKVENSFSCSKGVTLPIREEGTYKQSGDTIVCDADTFVIDKGQNKLKHIKHSDYDIVLMR